MNYLVFDTETTGLPPRAPRGAPPIPANDPRQPRLASFGAILTDAQGIELSRQKFYVKPEGWTMAEFAERDRAQGKKPAVEINGLTDEVLNAKGVPVAEVLHYYTEAILNGSVAVAFNAVFDLKIMRGELRRAGMDDLFEETPNICVMRALDPYGAQGLPIMRGFVKLKVAAEFFGFELDNHEVMSDTLGARWLLERLIKDRLLPSPTIKRAKNYQGDKGPAPTTAPPAPSDTQAPKPVPKDDGFTVPDKF